MANNPPYDPAAYRNFEHVAWTAVPGSYQTHFGILTSQAVDPLLDAVGTVQGTRLLEVACGPGHLSAAAATRGAACVGVDFVAEMVAEAQRRHPGIEFREGDAEALSFPDESFDAVVCGFGMLHFGRFEDAIAEAHRVLVPGGRYAYTVWVPPERESVNLRRIVRSAIAKHGQAHGLLPPAPAEFGDLEEMKRVLLTAGFVDVEATTLPIVGRWSEPEQVLETLYGGMGRTRALVEAQTVAARENIERAILESARRFERDGVIEIPMPAMLAHGRRASSI